MAARRRIDWLTGQPYNSQENQAQLQGRNLQQTCSMKAEVLVITLSDDPDYIINRPNLAAPDGNLRSTISGYLRFLK
jgi:hypothetical protein